MFPAGMASASLMGDVRVACFRSLCTESDWELRRKGINRAVADWVRTLALPQASVVDIVRPQRSEDVQCISCNVRILQPESPKLTQAPGLNGFLCRESPPEGTFVSTSGTSHGLNPCQMRTGRTSSAVLARQRNGAPLVRASRSTARDPLARG